MVENVESIDTHADWQTFHMHLFANFYNAIIDWYVPKNKARICPRQPFMSSTGKPRKHTVATVMANQYASVFEVITHGGKGSHYDKNDRDMADNTSPISNVDLSDLLL